MLELMARVEVACYKSCGTYLIRFSELAPPGFVLRGEVSNGEF